MIYAYDRLHEGQADTYSAELPELGLEFIFNEEQSLQTLFIVPGKPKGYCPIEEDMRLQTFASKAAAIQFAKQADMFFVMGKADFLGTLIDWVRLEYSEYSVHYGFVDGALDKMTLMSKKA